jgi:hypothetical protein
MQHWRQGFLQSDHSLIFCRGQSACIDGDTRLFTDAPALDTSMFVFSEFARLFLQGRLQD